MGLELFYEGQGKIINNIKLTPNTATPEKERGIPNASITTMTMGHEGLESPILEDTNKEVRGDDKCHFGKQNKQ
jgi:hypothetical protein